MSDVLLLSLFNSILGHHMTNSPGAAFYAATKHMVTALSEALRKAAKPKNIRVTVSLNITHSHF